MVATAALVVAVVPKGGNSDSMAGYAAVGADGDVTVNAADLSEDEATFIRLSDDSKMELLALRSADGSAKVALGTCQSCNGAPGAYYTQEDDVLQCNNCGLTFPLSVIEESGGGCHPIMLDEAGVRIVCSRDIKREKLCKVVEELGYDAGSSDDRNLQIASVLMIILAIYVIAKHLGWTNVFNLFPSLENTMSHGMLFAIGLLTSVHCIAMCGGINLTQSAVASQGRRNTASSNLEYNLGRVISYSAIGAAAGGIGRVISFSGTWKGVVSVLAGVVMFAMALRMLGIFVMGLHMIGNGITLAGLSRIPLAPESSRVAVQSGDVQVVRTEVDYGSYEAITVKSGIPVEWTGDTIIKIVVVKFP